MYLMKLYDDAQKIYSIRNKSLVLLCTYCILIIFHGNAAYSWFEILEPWKITKIWCRRSRSKQITNFVEKNQSGFVKTYSIRRPGRSRLLELKKSRLIETRLINRAQKLTMAALKKNSRIDFFFFFEMDLVV